MKTTLLIIALTFIQHTLAYDKPEATEPSPADIRPATVRPGMCDWAGRYACTTEVINGKFCYRVWCATDDKPVGEDLRYTYCLVEEVS